MGGVCCSEEKKYRFKGFVVSVYPDDTKGGPNEDALGKLNSYIGSNPERIPRVCRKISKIMQVHLNARKAERVMVSVKMLRSLIEHAKSVEGFVPHSIDMCAQLLAANEVRYKVGAADVLCALCVRLTKDPQSEPSRRLIADSKDRLLPPLRLMCSSKGPGGTAAADSGSSSSSSSTNAVALQSRYAGVVTIGQLAHCLGNALAGNVSELLFPIVANLLLVLKNRSAKPVDEEEPLSTLLFLGPPPPFPTMGAGSSANPLPLVTGPTSAEVDRGERNPDLAYARACVFAVGTTAGCVTVASVEALTEQLLVYMQEHNGWAVPAAPVVVFRALVTAMQERPQGLGFTVFQCLCRAGNGSTNPAVRIGILSALQACVTILPMSGGRPQLVLDYLRTAILNSPVESKDPNTKPTLNAIVSLTESLLYSVYSQHNNPQLQSVLAVLVRLLSDCTAEGVEPNEGGVADEIENSRSVRAEGLVRRRSSSYGQGAAMPVKVGARLFLVLRCVDAAAPYIRTTPLVDRQSGEVDVCSIIEPLLNSGDDSLRTWSARILRGVLAGMPSGTGEGVGASRGNEPSSLTAATVVTPTAGASMLGTDERDVAFAETWVKAIMGDTTSVTPRCIVEVGGVLTAIMAGYGVRALPFILTTLWSLQNWCVGSSAAQDPSSANMVTSRVNTSPLTRAWLHAVLAALASCGKIYEIPKLTDYARGVMSKRLAQPTSELATCFEPELRESTRAEHRFTVCGLTTSSTAGVRKDAPLSDVPNLGPVTKLPSFSYVANIIVDADRADVLGVFGVSVANDLKAAIERVCFGVDSETSVTLDTSGVASNGVARLNELRDGTEFMLGVSPKQLSALRGLQVGLEDRLVASSLSTGIVHGSGPLDPSDTSTGAAAGGVREVLDRLCVDASTGLLPPETNVDEEKLPLFDVSVTAHRSLTTRGRVHNRQLGRGQDDNSEGSERLPVRPDRGDEASTASADSGALRAQATLAEIGDDNKASGALAVALKMQREAQVGGQSAQLGVDGVPARRPWFSMLPSSQYVDLE